MDRNAAAEFLDRVDDDDTIHDELQAAIRSATCAAAVEFAARLGFRFTVDDLEAELSARASELSDHDLGKVAGGIWGDPHVTERKKHPRR